MTTTDAQGRTISDDGQWWWDGNAWQPVKKGFFDTFADSVETAVKKVEGSQASTAVPAAGAPTADSQAASAASASAAAAPAPAAAPLEWTAPAPAPAYPAIPPADLLAYLGALKGSGTVTAEEYETIRKRIPGQI